MKKKIILICLCSILFYDCGIKITPVNSNITESINHVTTQKTNAPLVSHQTSTQVTSNADKTFQVTTQKPNTTLDPHIAALVNISKKKLGEYSLDDCLVIFNSTFGDIGKAYKINVSKPTGGLILPGSSVDVGTPVIRLNEDIFLLCGNVDVNVSPHIIYFYGFDGESCVIDGFKFGMRLDKVDQEMLTIVKDSFFGTHSGNVPAKMVEIHKKGMVITLAFKQNLEDGYYYLDNVCVEI